ncbi:GNAT family N-acetyltransferase [Shewanella surugensis]|uniref:GNAT family N-acetyltransferase n=1 Tax=Shewanella surugensis TaxID=212020 RepID=A0ABT0LD56_9GAMM|nr:GNAT family N-acetyltransferase [Shewanella surugensis]MCL1125623.1 GNAT family N-acetyltransferase [Shewanella surugensis]
MMAIIPNVKQAGQIKEAVMDIKVTLKPLKEEIESIYAGLSEFNCAYFSDLSEQSIACFIRDEDNKIVGGLTALILLESLHVNYLWLAEFIRGEGLGKQLINRIEAEARLRGLKNLFLDTYTFQAPRFYERLGFVEVGRFRDYPKKDVDKIFYRKQIA